MSDKTPAPPVDPYARINFTKNSDGSLRRLPFPLPDIPADPNPSSPLLTIDFSINHSNNTWLRLFLRPRPPLDSNSPTGDISLRSEDNLFEKLPLIVYYHGGGFVSSIGAASALFHNFCSTLAASILVVIASVEYRLAPEHRLPAAYEDAVDALHWIKNTKEELFTRCVDLSNIFLMGFSAGANIAYNVGLRTAISTVDELEPLKIKGLILHHPYFGGTQRTESEIRMVNDEMVPQVLNDLMWELALPVGVERDHEYCNPMINGGSDGLDKIKVLGWTVGVTGCDGDPIMDRQIEFVKMVESKGVKVVSLFSEGGNHGVELRDPYKAAQLVAFVKDFVSSTIAN